MKRIVLLLSLLLAGCAAPRPSTAPAPHTEAAAVVQAANALFAAMASRDTAAIRAMFLPDARIVAVGRQDGATVARGRTVGEFLPGIVGAPEPLRERMWSPEVRVDGDLATLWAPYDFHRGAQFSHCGVDAFQFARVEGRWRIAALGYTVQRDGCPPAPRP